MRISDWSSDVCSSDPIGSFNVTENAVFYTLSENGISTSLFKYSSGQKPLKIDFPFSAGEIQLTPRSPYKKDIWATLTGWPTNNRQEARRVGNECDSRCRARWWTDH